jgi:hypothetical protein
MNDGKKTTAWSWEDAFPLLLAPVSAPGGWFLPEPYVRFLFAILVLGLLFDLLSLFYHVLTLATGKFRSGFPLVGLLLYVWFVLAYPKSLLAPNETEPIRVLLFKPLDLVLLVSLHLLFQLPLFFKRSRE